MGTEGFKGGLLSSLMIILLIAPAISIGSISALPDVIRVPQDYPTIQEAINWSSPGDTIQVAAGTYDLSNSLIVNKSVTLRGENPNITILNWVGGNHTLGNPVVEIEASDVVFSGFTIRNAPQWGIFVWGKEWYIENIMINGNIIKDAGTGIFLKMAREVTIKGNTVLDTDEGISFGADTGKTVIDGNVITNNGVGIHSAHSAVVIIANNTITNNGKGISMIGRAHQYVSRPYSYPWHGYPSFHVQEGYWLNTIYSNLIMNNEIGIRLRDSNVNVAIHNNLVKNEKQIHIEIDDSWINPTNWWDNGAQGNYWSDYGGKDLNGDGIGDTPYIIDANNVDNYPLMSPTMEIPSGEAPLLSASWFLIIGIVGIIAIIGIVAALYMRRR